MIPTMLIRMIRLDEKKYIMNSSGLVSTYAVRRAFMPKIRKNIEIRPMIIFLAHHDRETVGPQPLPGQRGAG